MKHYENLLEKGYFTREQLIEIVGTAEPQIVLFAIIRLKVLLKKEIFM